jgi:hypothetical protein
MPMPMLLKGVHRNLSGEERRPVGQEQCDGFVLEGLRDGPSAHHDHHDLRAEHGPLDHQEKTSRIFEVMLAIVPNPSDMLAGKLVGVGAWA